MVGSGEDEESTVGDWEERREERERDEGRAEGSPEQSEGAEAT